MFNVPVPHGRLSLCEGARAAERVDQPHFCLASMWHKERKYCDQRCCANEHVVMSERSATTRPSACTKPRKPFGSSQAFTGTFVSPQEMGARLEAPLDEGCNCAWDQQETAISVIPLRCARAGLGLTPPRSSVATHSHVSPAASVLRVCFPGTSAPSGVSGVSE